MLLYIIFYNNVEDSVLLMKYKKLFYKISSINRESVTNKIKDIWNKELKSNDDWKGKSKFGHNMGFFERNRTFGRIIVRFIEDPFNVSKSFIDGAFQSRRGRSLIDNGDVQTEFEFRHYFDKATEEEIINDFKHILDLYIREYYIQQSQKNN